MHNGLMRIRSQAGKIKDTPAAAGEQPGGGLQKMSKSLGNEIVVREVLKHYDPETLRFLLLSTHYRSPIEYSEDRLAELKRSLDNFHRFFERYQRVTGQSFYQLQGPTRRGKFTGEGAFLVEVERHRERFLECMDDDFNTGGAVGTLYELLTALNRFVDTKQLEGGKGDPADREAFQRGVVVLRELSQILGVFHEPPGAKAGAQDELVGGLMQLLIELRAEARKAKNFALGDQIRKRLGELGVSLEDRPGGTGWRRG
jgi:cysteinyl-tRNA synthetase